MLTGFIIAVNKMSHINILQHEKFATFKPKINPIKGSLKSSQRSGKTLLQPAGSETAEKYLCFHILRHGAILRV